MKRSGLAEWEMERRGKKRDGERKREK